MPRLYVNHNDIEGSIYTLLNIFDNPNREGLIDTPKRAAKALTELLTPIEPDIALFDTNGYSGAVVVNDIEFYSLCEHHLLPFFGTVSVKYIPKKKIIGLSKIPRIVEYCSKRLNTQEYLTENIADYLWNKLEPEYVEVNISARHLCVEMRGAKKKIITATKSVRGNNG